MTSLPYPFIWIRYSIGGYSGAAQALIDTGCEIPFVIPGVLANQLSPASLRRPIVTASGQRLRIPAFVGVLELLAQATAYEVDIVALGTEFLVGLPALEPYRVTFDHGQRLLIEP